MDCVGLGRDDVAVRSLRAAHPGRICIWSMPGLSPVFAFLALRLLGAASSAGQPQLHGLPGPYISSPFPTSPYPGLLEPLSSLLSALDRTLSGHSLALPRALQQLFGSARGWGTRGSDAAACRDVPWEL